MIFRPFVPFVIVASLLASSAVAEMGINVEKKQSRLQEVSDVKLRGKARSEFKTFKRKAEFYGVFYVNIAEKTAGAYWGASSLPVADSYAFASCQSKSKNPYHCELYARMLPKHYDSSKDGITLSRDGNKEFREYMRLQNPERYGAFAYSDNGAVGYSWAEPSRKSSEKEALRRCEKAARKILRKTPDHLRDIVSNAANQDCRVVHWSG